jgi:hypothetical protein
MVEPELVSVTLGGEHDAALWSRLVAAVAARGGSIAESSYSVGGSQEIIVYEVVLPTGRLELTSETYIGLVLKGPVKVVRELSNEVLDA